MDANGESEVMPMGCKYIYTWGNGSKRATLKGRRCQILARGRMNSALVEFVDDGQREIISRSALRRVNEEQK